MPTDWSGVRMNVRGCPVGYIRLTRAMPPGTPFLANINDIGFAEESGPGTVIGLRTGLVAVKENIRLVFQMRDEASTPEVRGSTLLDDVPAGVPVRKKAK